MWDLHLPTCPLSTVKAHESVLRTLLAAPDRSAIKVVPNVGRDVGLDREAKIALAHTAQEAAVDDSYFIDADHLLRGLLCFPNVASEALKTIPLDLSAAREASKTHRAKHPHKRSVYHRLFGRPFKAHRAIYIKLIAVIVVMVLAALVIRWLNY